MAGLPDPDVPADVAATAWVLASAALVLVQAFAGMAVVSVGLLATTSVNHGGHDGLFFSGSYRQLGVQAGTAAIVAVYALVVTFLIAAVVNRIIGHRVRRRHESLGLDLSQYGETAYDLGTAEVEVQAQPTAATAR